MNTTTDNITVIPADDYLAKRRRVDGTGTVDYRYAGDAEEIISYTAQDRAQVRVQVDGSISVMASGRQFVDRIDRVVPVAGSECVPANVHTEFSPAQARALALALIAAADEAEAV